MKKLIAVLVLTLPVMASPTLFSKYETVRQGLLSGSLADTQKSARALADAARAEKNVVVAKRALDVANAADLAKARAAFGPLSDELIKVRNTATGQRPAIGYCPMVKKSWLQPKGDIGNPYDAAMAKCGTLKE